MKVHTLIFALLCFSAFGQQEAVPNQFWNNYAHINPAFAGVEFKNTGGLSFQNSRLTQTNSMANLFGFYNTRVGDHHGLGAEVFSGSFGTTQSAYISMMYNYQFALKKNQRITLGIAPTFGQKTFNTEYDTSATYQTGSLPLAGHTNDLLTHAGITYSTKFIIAGFGVRNLPITNLASPSNGSYEYAPEYYGNLSLKVNVGSRSSYTNEHCVYLEGLYVNQNGFQYIQADLRAVLWDKLTLMGGFKARSTFIFGAGWDLYKKFRGMYTWQFTRSKLNNGLGGSTHEIALIYMLKND